jgi:hypothetical protein
MTNGPSELLYSEFQNSMDHFRGTFHYGRSRRYPGPGEEQGIQYRQATEPIARIGTHTPSQEEIAELAYAYWEARGRQHGSDREDWLRAERELWKRAR